MNFKTFSKGLLALLFVVMASSFTFDSPTAKYSPEGTWDYSVPGVQPGYENGQMVIVKDGKSFKITMVLNEYSKVDAEKVVYKKKDLSFSVWIETEEITVKGSFEEDTFKGTLSYFEGDFKITAERKAAE